MVKCEICGKGPQFGHNVSHSVRRTKRRWNVNLQRTTIYEQGKPRKVTICAKCLKARHKTVAIEG